MCDDAMWKPCPFFWRHCLPLKPQGGVNCPHTMTPLFCPTRATGLHPVLLGTERDRSPSKAKGVPRATRGKAPLQHYWTNWICAGLTTNPTNLSVLVSTRAGLLLTISSFIDQSTYPSQRGNQD